jgi:hypothetical protein
MAASPIVRVLCVPNGVAGRGGNGRAGIPTLKAAKGITSHQPLATSQCISNRYNPRLKPPVTRSKQTTVVLSNRYKCRPSEGSASRGKNVTEGSLFCLVPSGGMTSWLTHRPSPHFYPVQRANRNRRKPFKTNDGGIFYSIQKALPPGGGDMVIPRRFRASGNEGGFIRSARACPRFHRASLGSPDFARLGRAPGKPGRSEAAPRRRTP